MMEDWTECSFEDLLDYEQPTNYIVKSTKYNDNYKTPVLTAGKSFIKGYTNETEGIFSNLPTIIFDDFTTATQYVNFEFKVKSSAMKILVPTSNLINMPLVYYAMQVNQIRSDTHKRYWISVFSKKKFLLPPLPIQRAIVSKIESLFSSLDSSIAALKKAQEQLKIYRQAVLKKAFEGELTKEWREQQTDLPSGDASQESDERPYNLPEQWQWIKSGSLFSFVTSGSRGWAKYYSESGALFIRVTNLNFDTLSLDLRDEKNKYVNPPEGTEGKRTKVEEGDFLFSITGYLGMFAIAPKLKEAYVNQHVSLCRPNNGFNLKYVGYWIISKTGGLKHFNNNKKGAVKAGLNLTDLKTFPVPLCSLKEQDEIVKEIESRLSICDKMEESIKDSLEKAKVLRQSILKKAFEGKLLTDSEIEQCKREADYEPASVLLERIKKEKKK